MLRGLHFQTPPHGHAKLVLCLFGAVFDAVVDLRQGSPADGQFFTLELSAAKRNMLYVPKGLAHGFYVPSGEALMLYKTSTVHAPAHDAGIRWDSAGIPWPGSKPLVSARDAAFAPLAEFKSPFAFPPGAS